MPDIEYKWHYYDPHGGKYKAWFYEPSGHQYKKDHIFGSIVAEGDVLAARLNNAASARATYYEIADLEKAKLFIEESYQLYILQRL